MRNKEIRLILSCCAVSIAAIMVAFTAFAATLNVPGSYSYPHFDNAITAANPGDTILAAPGSYTETDIDFQGKAITVECAGPGDCTINCGPNDGDFGFIFATGEGSNSVLRGFTIQYADFAAILCDSGSPTITDCTMQYNGSPSIEPTCGGILSFDSSPTLSNCTISMNSAELCGGGGLFGGSPTFTNCNITDNFAIRDDPQTAGGLGFFGEGSPTVTGGNISYNTAWGAGGVYNGGMPGSLTMSGVAISYNSGFLVGGILSVDSSPTLTGCTLNYNSNWLFGPAPLSTSTGLEIAGGGPVIGPIFTGGAVFLGGSPTLSGCTLSYNSGWMIGGIVNADSPASLTVSDSTITLNGGEYVGGILTFEASPSITNCNISYNHAWGCCDTDYVGGVAFSGGSPTITGGNVSSNSAFGVGGIYCTYSVASPTLDGVTVNDNSGWVGGIYFDESAGTVTGCTISGNSGSMSEAGAGGIGIRGPELVPVVVVPPVGDVEITRSYFTGNTGEQGGLYSWNASPSLTNCIMSGNSGIHGGIGLEGSASSVTLMNSTIADNTGTDVGGLGHYGGTNSATVTNSILWGNTPSPQIEGTLAAAVTYSDVQGGYAGAGNINADPMFLAAGDYHIFLASPCVDVATPTGAPADDIDGDVRPQGAGYDMGADENLPDDDGDGVPSAYEMGPDGDPGYDGNNDGQPDWMQGNVSSFPTVDGGNYVTIECPAGTFFTHAGPGPNPSPADTPPGVTFPYGFFSFFINDLPTGAATTVTIHLSGPAPDDYWKYGRTPANPANHWYLFPLEVDADGDTTGAEKTGDTQITLHFVDGKRGDNDLTANGTIDDPGAPGVPGAADVLNPEPGTEDKSDSVCFIGTAADGFGL